MREKRQDDIRPCDVSRGPAEGADRKRRTHSRRKSLPTLMIRLFVRLGGLIHICLLKGLYYLLRGMQYLVLGVLYAPRLLKEPLRRLCTFLFRPIRTQMQYADHIYKNIRAAKRRGKGGVAAAAIRSVGAYLCGEDGLFITLFNCAAPIVSIAFFLGVIHYGASLDYGLSVEYNGEALGVVTSESEVDSATREVKQRIADVESADLTIHTPRLSLTILDDGMPYVTTAALANRMLEHSDVPLTEAWGVYLDGRFYAAVHDKTIVEDALLQNLAEFQLPDQATDVGYQKEVTYQSGLYVADSLMDEKALCEKLTQTTRYETTHTVGEYETLLTIALRYSMEKEELIALNPELEEDDTLVVGQRLTVEKESRVLPIVCTVQMTIPSFIEYDTVELETSAVNNGDTKVLVPGERGEKSNVVDVFYVNGTEESRTVISSTILKEPVSEQIGIGTYSAAPSSGTTKLNGTGQFSWPVNGGYISDPFISNRNHKGLDIAAPAGTEIYAAADGVVTVAGWNSGGYGYLVMIDHGNGYTTVYGHCSVIWAAVGQTVSRGQSIATVGSTGNSTGNHLHFEVRENGICRDPGAYIRVNTD